MTSEARPNSKLALKADPDKTRASGVKRWWGRVNWLKYRDSRIYCRQTVRADVYNIEGFWETQQWNLPGFPRNIANILYNPDPTLGQSPVFEGRFLVSYYNVIHGYESILFSNNCQKLLKILRNFWYLQFSIDNPISPRNSFAVVVS